MLSLARVDERSRWVLMAVGGHTATWNRLGSRVNTFRNSYANSSGSVIRKALKSLDALKWVDKSENGKGRILSKQ
ncbi:hypothetical protein PRIPAC_71670, partial [Pristionchus pacificus]|uniref:Ribosomal protein n=1 Tax=Pristionchus pacificus TaxID=54126 RepID=A0A2A6CF77_PRIPA